MKLDAMRESEALKMVNKKSRRPPAVAVIKKSGLTDKVSLRDRIDEEPLSPKEAVPQSSNLSILWEEEKTHADQHIGANRCMIHGSPPLRGR